MARITIKQAYSTQRVTVRKVNHYRRGHRVTIGHSLFIDGKNFIKVMKMAGRV